MGAVQQQCWPTAMLIMLLQYTGGCQQVRKFQSVNYSIADNHNATQGDQQGSSNSSAAHLSTARSMGKQNM